MGNSLIELREAGDASRELKDDSKKSNIGCSQLADDGSECKYPPHFECWVCLKGLCDMHARIHPPSGKRFCSYSHEPGDEGFAYTDIVVLFIIIQLC